jgi:hypothetical protein
MLQNVLKGVVLAAAVIVAASAPPLWSISAQESVECNKERYAEKFGDPYSILTQPIKPAMQGGFVVAKVVYPPLPRVFARSYSAPRKYFQTLFLSTRPYWLQDTSWLFTCSPEPCAGEL